MLFKISDVLGNVKEGASADKDALLAMILAEVRILYKNQAMMD